MRELSLHLLDIAENGIRAGADRVAIRVEESSAGDRLTLCVEDNGSGMPEDKIARIDDPFVTTRTTRRVGLGLSLLAAASRRWLAKHHSRNGSATSRKPTGPLSSSPGLVRQQGTGNARHGWAEPDDVDL